MAQLADFDNTLRAGHSSVKRHGGIRALWLSLARLIDTVLDWQERARQRHHLSGLDDRLIRDMGLSRAEVDEEIHKPFWRS